MTLYKILGVGPKATKKQIDEAYRKLSLKHHPDHGGSADDVEKLKQISNAYRILADPVRRERYDETGEDDPKNPMTEADSRIAEMIPPAFLQDQVHPIEFMLQRTDAMRGKHETQRAEAKSTRRKLITRLGEFKRENEDSENQDGCTFVAELLLFRISECDSLISEISAKITVCNQVLEKLDGLKRGRGGVQTMSWPMTSTTTTY